MGNLQARLTGRIALHRAGAVPRLANERPDVLAAVCTGRPASALPGLMSALFAMCGHAQHLTAQRAVRAALGEDTSLSAGQARVLQTDTLREHLRRLWLDWPRLLWGAQTQGGEATRQLVHSPIMRGGPLVPDADAGAPPSAIWAAQPACQQWLAEHLFQQDLWAWLSGWQAGGDAFLIDWCQACDSLPARLVRSVWPLASACTVAMPGLNATAPGARPDGQAWHALAKELARDAALARQPRWGAMHLESGPWCRAFAQAGTQPHTLLSRMGGRLADLARLALPDQAPDAVPLQAHAGVRGPLGLHVLQAGALSLGAHSALAWTDMARGTLLHWVRLDAHGPQPRVLACRVVSPTEWNAHAQGPMANLLARPGLDLAQTQVLAAVVAAVYDPCVPLVVLGADGQPMVQTAGVATDPALPASNKEPSCTN